MIVGVAHPRLHAFERVEQHLGEGRCVDAACGEIDARRLGLRPDRHLDQRVDAAPPLGDDVAGQAGAHVEDLRAVRGLLDVLHQAVERIGDEAVEPFGERAGSGKLMARHLQRTVEHALRDGAVDVGLVAEDEVERGARELGGARDVVHRRAREAVGEEDFQRALHDARAPRILVRHLHRQAHVSILHSLS